MSDQSLPGICRMVAFEDINSIVCEIDLRSHRVNLAHTGSDGKPYGSLKIFIDAQPQDAKPVISMNAGMYEKNLSPVGLHVEEGKQVSPLKTGDGAGNFFLKPNGVFFIDKYGTPGILETSAFVKAAPDTRIATQSGPMLVIDGQIHPRFEPNGTSRFIRNGVGVRDASTIVLAISKEPVNLGSFARLFKDELGCANALFFDGGISTLANDRQILIGGMDPVGPIITIFEK